MNPKSNPNAIRHNVYWFYLFFVSLTIPLNLNSQTVVFDTIYQSNNEIFSLNYSNGCIYWNEFVNDEFIIYRIYNGVLESRKLPLEYASCNYGNGLYAYGDFLYVATTNGPGQTECNQGFLWGENSFILDTLGIGSICKAYQNIILTQDETLIDINTGTKTVLNLEDAQYRYSSSNICSLNDSVVNIKAFKYDKSTNERIGQAIIQFDLQENVLKEIFQSSNFLHFTNKFSTGKSVVFSEEHPSFNPDSSYLYFYNGIDVKTIARGWITNGYAHSYLGGVVYSMSNNLFYWEDGHTSVLSNNAFRMAIDNCKITWFSRYGNNNVDFKIFDGTTYLSKSFLGNPSQESLTLFDENKFIFAPIGDSGESKYYIFKGEHGLMCSDSCEDMDIEILNGDTKNYLKARKIESNTMINEGNVIYKAQESIQLLSGFSVTNNSEFVAKLENCDSQVNLRNREDEVANNSLNDHQKTQTEKIESKIWIGQNNPNPFNADTSIPFYIPRESKSAKITLYNFTGMKLKEITVNSFGAGSIDLKIDNFSEGIYYYNIEVDGNLTETRKMLLIK